MDVGDEHILEIKDLVIEYHGFERSWRHPFGTLTPFRALNGLSLSVSEGETIGLIGRNGSGKTTLLRSIFGSLRPLSGSILTKGRVILLSGTDPGFIPLLSGRQNVKLLASVYGIEERQIDDFVSDVEHFANIGDAFDRQFIGYSTGMRGKVGFGFMTGIDADILLIDETLGVGDQEFRSKSKRRLQDFIERSGTVIISTHSMGLAREVCDRGLVMEDGRIDIDGTISDAVHHYDEISAHPSKQK